MGAATLDPERLLWVPGAKVISIPNPYKSIGMLSKIDERGVYVYADLILDIRINRFHAVVRSQTERKWLYDPHRI
jgi:hypothetical protein